MFYLPDNELCFYSTTNYNPINNVVCKIIVKMLSESGLIKHTVCDKNNAGGGFI